MRRGRRSGVAEPFSGENMEPSRRLFQFQRPKLPSDLRSFHITSTTKVDDIAPIRTPVDDVVAIADTGAEVNGAVPAPQRVAIWPIANESWRPGRMLIAQCCT